jgi:hypothetical protein
VKIKGGLPSGEHRPTAILATLLLAVATACGSASNSAPTGVENRIQVKPFYQPGLVAVAGSAPSPSSGVPGYRYFTSTATCDSDKMALSGGWTTPLNHASYFQVVSSRRVDEQTWQITAAVAGSGPDPVVAAQAECFSRTEVTKLQEYQIAVDIPAGVIVRDLDPVQKAVAKCPDDSQRVGGGFAVSRPEVTVHSSSPWVAGIAGLPVGTSDQQSWNVGVFHPAMPATQRVIAFVECLITKANSTVHIDMNSSYTPGEGVITPAGLNRDQGLATCMRGQYTGGGYSYLGYTDSPAHIATNQVVHNGYIKQASPTPLEGWAARLYSRSQPGAEATIFNTFAVCLQWLSSVPRCPTLYQCFQVEKLESKVFLWSPKYGKPIQVCWKAKPWPPSDPTDLDIKKYVGCALLDNVPAKPFKGPDLPPGGNPPCTLYQCIELDNLDGNIIIWGPDQSIPTQVCWQIAALGSGQTKLDQTKLDPTPKTAACG